MGSNAVSGVILSSNLYRVPPPLPDPSTVASISIWGIVLRAINEYIMAIVNDAYGGNEIGVVNEV